MDVNAAAREVFDVATHKGMLFVTNEKGSDELVGFFVPARHITGLGKALVASELGKDSTLALIDAAKLKTNKSGDNIAVEIPIEAWRAVYPFFEDLKKREES